MRWQIGICGDEHMGIKLGNICRFQSGGTPAKGRPEFFNGTIPWITTTALNGGNIGKESAVDWICEQAIKESAAKIVPAFSIMVGTRVGVGKVAINTISMSTSQDIVSLLDIDESIWSKAFLCKFLQAKGAFLNAQARGATIKGIKIDVLSELELPEIPIEEQQHISQIIDKVKTTIAMRQSQLQKLDKLVKARFVEMFGAHPLNPMGWKKGTIRDVVADVRYGSSRPAVDGGKYPYLRMNNITYGGELDLSDVKRIDVPENELGKCTVRRGDVLFNRTNSKELVGKTCVYDRDEMMVLAGFVIRVRVNDLVLPEFLSAFLNTEFSKRTLLGMCKAAIGQANINAQEMQSIGIYIPPIERQQEFVQFKNQTDKSKAAVQKALDETQLLFDRLMQDYFG